MGRHSYVKKTKLIKNMPMFFLYINFKVISIQHYKLLFNLHILLFTNMFPNIKSINIESYFFKQIKHKKPERWWILILILYSHIYFFLFFVIFVIFLNLEAHQSHQPVGQGVKRSCSFGVLELSAVKHREAATTMEPVRAEPAPSIPHHPPPGCILWTARARVEATWDSMAHFAIPPLWQLIWCVAHLPVLFFLIL